MKVGAKIKAARMARGLSMNQLAARIGVSSATMSRWENDVDRPSKIYHLKALAETLVQPLDYFSGDTPLTKEQLADLTQRGQPVSWRARKRLEAARAQLEELFNRTGEGKGAEWDAYEQMLGGLLAKTARHGESAQTRKVK